MKNNLNPSDPNFEWRWISPEEEQQELQVGQDITSKSNISEPIEESSEDLVELPNNIEWREITPEQQNKEDQFRNAINGNNVQSDESYLGTAGRNIGASLIKGITSLPSAIGSIANLPSNLLSSILPHGQDIRQAQRLISPSPVDVLEQSAEPLRKKAEKTLNLPSDYLTPKNSTERIIQGVGENLPASLLPISGIGKAATLTKRIAGSVGALLGSETAKELGSGPLGQIGGGLVGSLLSGTNPKGLVKRLPGLKQKAYETATNLGKDITVNAKPLTRKLLDIEEIAKDTLSGPLKKKYAQQLINSSSKIIDKSKKTNKFNLNDISDLDKELNLIFFDKNVPDSVRHSFFDKIKPKFEQDIIQNLAKQHPEWGQVYNTGKNLNTFIKGTEAFSHIIKGKDITNAFRDLPVGLGAWVLAGLAGGDISKAIKFGGLVYKSPKYIKDFITDHGGISGLSEIYGNPATNKIMSEMLIGAAENNKGVLLSAIKNLKDIK